MSEFYIDKLTPEQEALLPVYAKNWIEKGFSTAPCNMVEAEKYARMAYEAVGYTPPQWYLHTMSPIGCAILSVLLEVHGGENDENLEQAIAEHYTPGRNYYAEWPQIREQLLAAGIDNYKERLEQRLQGQAYGSHDAGWLAFYAYFDEVIGHPNCVKCRGLVGLADHTGWWAACEKVAIFQDRYCELHRLPEPDGRLHKDLGMALKYRDGWGIYSLNGVHVPEHIAMTPGEQLDPGLIMTEENVEIRREILRKIGAERWVYKVGGKVLDKSTDANGQDMYELLEVPMGKDVPAAKCLKMLNPSVPETWHTEFVGPECTTVQDALNFRNGFKASEIDDENGADWFQQGDVIFTPAGATKFKSRPKQLT